MPTDRQYCGGKICYSEREANQVLHDCRHTGARRQYRRSTNKVIPKRKYYCKDCGMYHLTSIPFYKEI